MQDGTVVHVFDGRLQMPLYDHDLDNPEYVEQVTQHWTKISEQYPLTSKELDNIVRGMFGG